MIGGTFDKLNRRLGSQEDMRGKESRNTN